MSSKYFLTVDRCNQGKRGIFCNTKGTPFSKGEPHTKEEMQTILGAFSLILSPESTEFTEEELKDFRQFQPLAEYSKVYGIVRRSQ